MVFVLSIAPQSDFKSGHLSILPFTTHIYSHNSPLQTLPWSPLWHFQVFTVVTNIEGKQQTEPLPVSASHWETNPKHYRISPIKTAQTGQFNGSLIL